MRKIGVVVNREKDKDASFTRGIVNSIVQLGGEVFLPMELANVLNLQEHGLVDDLVFRLSDVVVSLGGDGTFLKTARHAYQSNVPILGINLGTLGFLTEVDRQEIDEAIKAVMLGEYNVEERMMLEMNLIREGNVVCSDIALNEFVISRGAISRIIHIDTYINNSFVDNFPGDGLIIATPTGSTAYSLSAGGPIVEPDVDLIIITPICPHILYSRSIITTGDRTVKAVISGNQLENAMLTIDGQEGYPILCNDSIEITKASNKVKIARLKKSNFFNILRKKFYDRGECLIKDEIH